MSSTARPTSSGGGAVHMPNSSAFSLNNLFQRTAAHAAQGSPNTSSRPPVSPRDSARQPLKVRGSSASIASPRTASPSAVAQRLHSSNSAPRHLHSLQGLFRPANPSLSGASRPHSAHETPSVGGAVGGHRQPPPSPRGLDSGPPVQRLPRPTAVASSARPPTAPSSLGGGGGSSGAFSLNGSGSAGGGSIPSTPRGVGAQQRSQQAFHKGVVSALGGVLRGNRGGPSMGGSMSMSRGHSPSNAAAPDGPLSDPPRASSFSGVSQPLHPTPPRPSSSALPQSCGSSAQTTPQKEKGASPYHPHDSSFMSASLNASGSVHSHTPSTDALFRSTPTPPAVSANPTAPQTPRASFVRSQHGGGSSSHLASPTNSISSPPPPVVGAAAAVGGGGSGGAAPFVRMAGLMMGSGGGSGVGDLPPPPLYPSGDKERREQLVNQKRSEWVKQRNIASARDRRRALERDVLQRGAPHASGAPEQQGAVGGADDGLTSRWGSSYRAGWGAANPESEEAAERRNIEGAEADAFDVVVRCVTMLMSRHAMRSEGGAGGSDVPSSPAAHDRARSASSHGGRAAQLRRDQLSALEQLRMDGNARYKERNYAGAHMAYSRVVEGALSCTAGDRDAISELHALALLNRCATGLALLNYDGCVADGLEVVRLSGAGGARPLSKAIRAKAWLRVAKAYALLEAYKSAEEAYGHALGIGGDGGGDGGELAALHQQAKGEHGALPMLQRVRSHCQSGRYKEALGTAISEAAAIKPYRDEAPLVLALYDAESRVSPSTARAEGSKYVSALLVTAEHCDVRVGGGGTVPGSGRLGSHSRPASAANAAGASFAPNALLLSNFTQHICDALIVVGRAAFFSGPLFINVASQKIAMCTSLRYDHKGAAALRKEVEAYERFHSNATSYLAANKLSAALDQLTMLLSMAHKLSGPLVASAALSRADVLTRLNNTPSAVTDTTTAIEADPGNARAYAARSRLFQGMGDYQRALRDMTMAASLTAGPSGTPSPYQDDVEALKEQCREENDPFAGFGFAFGAGGSGGGGSGRRCNSARPGTSGPPPFGPRAGDGAGDGASRARNIQSARPAKRCPFKVLGLAPSASMAQVKQAYKRLVLTCHPDKLVSAAPEVRAQKELLFKDVSKAYAEITESKGPE